MEGKWAEKSKVFPPATDWVWTQFAFQAHFLCQNFAHTAERSKVFSLAASQGPGAICAPGPSFFPNCGPCSSDLRCSYLPYGRNNLDRMQLYLHPIVLFRFLSRISVLKQRDRLWTISGTGMIRTFWFQKKSQRPFWFCISKRALFLYLKIIMRKSVYIFVFILPNMSFLHKMPWLLKNIVWNFLF